MYEIIYSSVAAIHLSAKDITNILHSAQDFNARHHITGCLLYHNGEFLQVLEGDKEIVQALYQKIALDPRHTHSKILAEGDKEERAFDQWQMAFHQLSEDDIEHMGRELFVDNFITFSDMVKKPTFSMILFWTMVKQLLTR